MILIITKLSSQSYRVPPEQGSALYSDTRPEIIPPAASALAGGVQGQPSQDFTRQDTTTLSRAIPAGSWWPLSPPLAPPVEEELPDWDETATLEAIRLSLEDWQLRLSSIASTAPSSGTPPSSASAPPTPPEDLSSLGAAALPLTEPTKYEEVEGEE